VSDGAIEIFDARVEERPRARPVRGLLAPALGAVVTICLLVAVAAIHKAPDARTSPIYPPGGWLDAYRVAIVLSFVCYLAGLYLVRRGARLAVVVALAAAIQLVPLLAPVLYSTDAYTYWDYGRVDVVHHGNQYEDPPSRFPDDPAYALMGAQWHNTTSAYGPVLGATFDAHARVVGDSERAAGGVYKVWAAFGMLLLIGAAAAAAPPGRRALAAAFVGWNPLLALHFAGGGHNDAWMLGFVLLGIALAQRGRRDLGGAMWAVAIAIKWLPLVLLPLELLRTRGRFGWRGFGLGVLSIAAVSTVIWGLHWVSALSPLSSQLKRASSTSLPYHLGQHGIPTWRATEALTVLFGLAYLWLARQAWRGRRRGGLTMGLFCLSLSWLPPWYATWALAPAAIEEDTAGTVLALGLSAWLLRDSIPL
jgi:glycosyl transferase family 87